MRPIIFFLICFTTCFFSCTKEIYESMTSDLLTYQALQNDGAKTRYPESIDTVTLIYESLLLFNKGRKQVFSSYKATLAKMIKEDKDIYMIEASYNGYRVIGCIWSGEYELYYRLSSNEKPIVGTSKSKKKEIEEISSFDEWRYMKEKVEAWNKKELFTLSRSFADAVSSTSPMICSKIKFDGSKIKELDMIFLYQFHNPDSWRILIDLLNEKN